MRSERVNLEELQALRQTSEIEMAFIAPSRKIERNKRNIYKRLFIVTVFLCLLLVCVCILLAVIKPDTKKKVRPYSPMSITDLSGMHYLFPPENYLWLSNGQLSYSKEMKYVVSMDDLTNTESIVYDKSKVHNQIVGNISQIQIFPFTNRLLVGLNKINIPGGRKRSLKSYCVYDPQTEKHACILNPAQPLEPPPLLRMAVPSPNGRSLIYWWNGGLYYVEDLLDEAKNTSIHIISPPEDMKELWSYGITDWLYEEEILQTTEACWWSTNASYALFLLFDDSQVSTIQFPIYGPPSRPFVHIQTFRYPLAGDEKPNGNPRVKIHIWSVNTKTVQEISTPNFVVTQEHYIESLKWYDDEHFIVQWQLRDYSTGYLTLYSIKTQKWIQLFVYKPTKGWSLLSLQSLTLLDYPSSEAVMADRTFKRIFFIAPQSLSHGEYFSIGVINLNGSHFRWITGNKLKAHDVQAINHVNKDFIYYTAYYPDATYLHLIRVEITTGDDLCVSCAIPQCDVNTFTFSPTGQAAIHMCQGSSLTYIRQVSISNDGAIKTMKVLHNNTDLFLEHYRNVPFPTFEYRQITVHKNTANERTFQSRIFYPANFSREYKYPLVLHVYGGPGSLAVQRSSPANMVPPLFLSGKLNCIVLEVDGRGTRGRGRDFMVSIQHAAGVIDAQDYLDATREFIKSEEYIDPKRVAVEGASYGGFLAGHILAGADNNSVFSCGALAAAVTDFRYYDTAYTERFMGRVTQYPEAYKKTSLILKAHQFHNKKMMIIHGTSDDNVRFLNAMHLLGALTEEEVPFKLRVYKDASHDLHQDYLPQHLPHFLKECLSEN